MVEMGSLRRFPADSYKVKKGKFDILALFRPPVDLCKRVHAQFVHGLSFASYDVPRKNSECMEKKE